MGGVKGLLTGTGLSAQQKKAIGLVSVMLTVALSLALFFLRDSIRRYEITGYAFIALSCFLLNAGVFGLSPSGLVAIQASFVFDPCVVSLIAGVSSGAAEVMSYVAGVGSRWAFRPSEHAGLRNISKLRLFLISATASFLSGNLADALGVLCGRARSCFAPFMFGCVLAKTTKMLVLVMLAHSAFDFLVKKVV